jgi:NADH-quinone oxidoreductase subunit J
VAVLVVFGGLSWLAVSWNRLQVGPGLRPGDALMTEFGQALVNPAQFAIPFEVASVLLLAALVGAIYIAIERKGGNA